MSGQADPFGSSAQVVPVDRFIRCLLQGSSSLSVDTSTARSICHHPRGGLASSPQPRKTSVWIFPHLDPYIHIHAHPALQQSNTPQPKLSGHTWRSASPSAPRTDWPPSASPPTPPPPPPPWPAAAPSRTAASSRTRYRDVLQRWSTPNDVYGLTLLVAFSPRSIDVAPPPSPPAGGGPRGAVHPQEGQGQPAGPLRQDAGGGAEPGALPHSIGGVDARARVVTVH